MGLNESNKIRMNEIESELSDLVREYYEIKYGNREFNPKTDFIQNSGKVFNQEEIFNIVLSALDGWWTEGRLTKQFEKKLRKHLGIFKLFAVNSGSSANLIALSAFTSDKLGNNRLKKGDEVITVAAGFPTTVNPIIQNGLIPVFFDVELGYYNIDISQIEENISNKTRAIFLAHTLGNPFNLDKIIRLCKKYDLYLIEDCCDALGSTYDNQLVGTFGDISTISFYPAHQMTTGEGGAVFSNNAKLMKIAKSFRDWGRDCWCDPGKDNTCGKRFKWELGDLPYGFDHKYIYSHLGYNLKITDMQSAIGLAQVEKLPLFIEKRKENFHYFHSVMKDYEDHIILPDKLAKSEPSWFGYPITIRDSASFSRLELVNFLNINKIGTRNLFGGNLTRQPYFKNQKYRIAQELKKTDKVMNSTFWIGVWPGIDEDRREYMMQKFDEFFSKH